MSRLFYAGVVLVLLCCARPSLAQDDDVPLGDVARSFRRPKPAEEQVIDNDNLPVMMDQAQAERLEGKPIFSIDPSGKAFRMTSPDGSCSLSFDARATSLISTAYVSTNLPQDELLKLDRGEATIHGGALQVSLHNGTAWELKEIVVGVTVLQESMGSALHPATLALPAGVSPARKTPDTTFLYHLKASGPPDAVTVFEGNLGDDLADARNWRWALIAARGVPPAAPGSVAQPAPALSFVPGGPAIPAAVSATAVPAHSNLPPSLIHTPR